jgi:CelD/BcsL family acetyltransferase involved in cellulose biosynthesis
VRDRDRLGQAAEPRGEGLRVRWVHGDAGLEELSVDWSDLVERDPEASVFQTPEWTTCWWRHFGTGEPSALAVHRGSRLVALAPLARRTERRAGLGLRTLTFVGERPYASRSGEPQADHLGVLADASEPDALDAAADALADAASDVDWVRLHEMPAGTRAEDRLGQVFAARGLEPSVEVCSRTPLLHLERPWQEIEASYPLSLRKRLRRARRKQAEHGGLSYRRWRPEPAEVPALLLRLQGVEARSWKGRKGVGIFSTERSLGFLLELSSRFAERRWLDVALLLDGESIAAYRFGFRFRGSFLDYNLAHDARYAALSPGRVLLDEVIRDSHREGLAWIDASGGGLATPNLLSEWTSNVRWHRRWMLFGPSLRGKALALYARRRRTSARTEPA